MQKWCIDNITSVLEGIQLIVKKSRNPSRWLGRHAAEGISGQLGGLTQDLRQLQNEWQLDHRIHVRSAQLWLHPEDTSSQRHPWTARRADLVGWAPSQLGLERRPQALDSGEGSALGCKSCLSLYSLCHAGQVT